MSTTDTSYEYTVTETIGGAGTITVEPLYKSGCLNNHANTELKGKVEATCGRGGYSGDQYCADCGELLGRGEKLAPLGHKWDAGTVVTDPTSENAGRKLYTCKTCGATSTEIVDKLAPSINDATIKYAYTAFTYTGKQIDVAKYVTVTYKGKTLVKGKDYDISYQNGVNVGCQTCTVTVSGIGDYTGSASKKVTIKPPKLAAPTLSTKDSAIIVNWKKVTTSAVGYQIIYDKVADFDTSANGHTADYHTTTVTDLNTLTKTLSAYTKPGETWYVKVRAFITSDGTVNGTRYGNYSAVKTIKIK